MRELPTVITLLGFVLGLDGLLFWPDPLALAALALSLFCDAIDGWIARELEAVTALGARLDWTVDVALAYSIAWRCMPRGLALAWLAGLVLVQTVGARVGRHRVSGRTIVTVAAAIWLLGSS